MLATILSSHDGDGATKPSWPQRDVDVESCWQVMPATALPGRLGCCAM
jgi:hypothetical protein